MMYDIIHVWQTLYIMCRHRDPRSRILYLGNLMMRYLDIQKSVMTDFLYMMIMIIIYRFWYMDSDYTFILWWWSSSIAYNIMLTLYIIYTYTYNIIIDTDIVNYINRMMFCKNFTLFPLNLVIFINYI